MRGGPMDLRQTDFFPERSSSSRRGHRLHSSWLVLSALISTACAGDGRFDADGGPIADAPPIFQDCTGLEKSQGLAMPCCLKDGADACGAGLFCAAFDGRRVPTCYQERSRPDLTSCTADVQCVSGSCHLQAKRCRSQPATRCEAAVGCARAANGDRQGCDTQNGRAVCRAVGTGALGEFCGEPTDCESRTCFKNVCKIGVGEACSLSDIHCAEAACMPCNNPRYVVCASPDHAAECVVSCDHRFWATDCAAFIAPAPPSDLRCPFIGYRESGIPEVQLSWVDNSTDEHEFVIEMKGPRDDWNTRRLVPADATTVAAFFFSSDGRGEFLFRVRARGFVAYSAPSNDCSVAIP